MNTILLLLYYVWIPPVLCASVFYCIRGLLGKQEAEATGAYYSAVTLAMLMFIPVLNILITYCLADIWLEHYRENKACK